MGFNKRKMEDRRRQAAETEAAARRATERQILEDADHLIAVWNERHCRLLVPTGAMPGLPHHRRCRSTRARLAPRRGRDGPNPCAVVPLLPAERAVRRARLPVQVERGRGVLCRAQRQSVGQ
jgi:hypothetical protein